MRDIGQKILDLIIEEASYLETKDEVRAVYSALMSISLEIGEIMRQIGENEREASKAKEEKVQK